MRVPNRTGTARWQRLRRQVLAKDGYRCRTCGRAGRLEVDHKHPVQRGGAPWAMGNLQALCRGCHIRKTRGENRRPRSPAEGALGGPGAGVGPGVEGQTGRATGGGLHGLPFFCLQIEPFAKFL